MLNLNLAIVIEQELCLPNLTWQTSLMPNNKAALHLQVRAQQRVASRRVVLTASKEDTHNHQQPSATKTG